jgi:hypothetical protein
MASKSPMFGSTLLIGGVGHRSGAAKPAKTARRSPATLVERPICRNHSRGRAHARIFLIFANTRLLTSQNGQLVAGFDQARRSAVGRAPGRGKKWLRRSLRCDDVRRCAKGFGIAWTNGITARYADDETKVSMARSASAVVIVFPDEHPLDGPEPLFENSGIEPRLPPRFGVLRPRELGLTLGITCRD